MSIQWFPGHMAAARKQAAEQMENTDVVIEGVPFGTYQVFAGRGDAAPTLVKGEKGAVEVVVNQTIPTQTVDVPVQGP